MPQIKISASSEGGMGRTPDRQGFVAAAAASGVSQLSLDYRQNFEDLTTETLRNVFGMPCAEAVAAVSEFFSPSDRDPSPEEALYVYHLSPLQIAADLAGAGNRPLSDREVEAYAATLKTAAHHGG